MHPHTNCPSCSTEKQAEQDAHCGAFAVACVELYRGSWQDLFEKLLKRGFRVTKAETPK